MNRPGSNPPIAHLIVQARLPAEALLTREELARATGISPETLQRLIRIGLVEPEEPDQFTAATAERLDRMLRLHHDLEVDLIGAAIIVDLLERLDRMEADLRQLRRDRH